MLSRILGTYSNDDKRTIMSTLKDKGHKVPKSWKVVHTEQCGANELNFDLKPLLTELSQKHGFSKEYFAIDIVSNPDEESRLDFGQFRVRYRYGIALDHIGEPLIKDNTRDFCAALIRAKKIYRREDISIMSFRGANPIAKQNYSIFNLKGHWNCRHAWIREVYVVERDPAETENNPIVEKTTLMNKQELKKAIAEFKKANGNEGFTQEEIVEINKELLGEQKFVDVKVDDKILRIDSSTIEEGAAVSWIDEAGEVSEVPNGEVTIPEEGKVVTIEDGKISAVVDVEEEAEEDEAEESAELMSEEKVKEIVKTELSAVLKDELPELLKGQLDEFSTKIEKSVDEKFEAIPAFAKVKTSASFSSSEEKEEEKEEKPAKVRNVNAPFKHPKKKEE